MRKSKFNPTKIAKILKEFDLGKDVAFHGNTVYQELRYTNGANGMVAWKPVS